ncbi:MAG: type II toxin-antitoxin system RelE/ParE family toxin [Pseudomonadota bacterium]
MLKVEKTDQFILDLEGIVLHIAQDNVPAAVALEEHMHDQVDNLKDPNFPRRRGRKAGTLELVAHPNYLVVLKQTETLVTALAIMHVARQYP